MYGISERIIKKIVLEHLDDDLLFEKIKDEISEYINSDEFQSNFAELDVIENNYYNKTKINEMLDGLCNKVKSDIIGTAKEDFDTLGEISNWIENHPDMYNALIEQISKKVNDDEFIKEIEKLSKNDKSINEICQTIKSSVDINTDKIRDINSNLNILENEIIELDSTHNTDVSKLKGIIQTLEENLNNKIEETSDKLQEKGDYPVYLPYMNRKTIQLENYDSLSGKTTKGIGVNIAMVSKWDIVDLGSSTISLNLNGKGDRPTYNDTNEIALMSDINPINTWIEKHKNDYDDILKFTNDNKNYINNLSSDIINQISEHDKDISSINLSLTNLNTSLTGIIDTVKEKHEREIKELKQEIKELKNRIYTLETKEYSNVAASII